MTFYTVLYQFTNQLHLVSDTVTFSDSLFCCTLSGSSIAFVWCSVIHLSRCRVASEFTRVDTACDWTSPRPSNWENLPPSVLPTSKSGQRTSILVTSSLTDLIQPHRRPCSHPIFFLFTPLSLSLSLSLPHTHPHPPTHTYTDA
jgi:hypothetical protein